VTKDRPLLTPQDRAVLQSILDMPSPNKTLADAWDEGVRYATGSMDADVSDNPYRKN
jgi:hypothetical protein